MTIIEDTELPSIGGNPQFSVVFLVENYVGGDGRRLIQITRCQFCDDRPAGKCGGIGTLPVYVITPVLAISGE